MKTKNTTVTTIIVLCAIAFLLNISGIIGSFAILGWLSPLGVVSWVVDLVWYLFPLWLIFVLVCRQISSGGSRYDEVFGKNLNEWTKEDKQYVNDLFEFIAENEEK